jgi:NitT/TauT family transport system permease protein
MKKTKAAAQTLYAMLAVVFFWYVLHWTVSAQAVPAPHVVIIHFLHIFPGVLWGHVFASFGRLFAALGLSLALGGAAGLWTGLCARADRLITPVVYLLYPLPKIAFLPVFMIVFGLGDAPKIMLIFFIVVFQFVLAARDGVRQIPREWFLAVASLGLSRPQVYRHLILPAVLPRLLTAMRVGSGIGVSVFFLCENFATDRGIGYFIMYSWLMADYVDMFAGILALGLMGGLIFWGIDVLEARCCRWLTVGKAGTVCGENAD